VAVAASWGQLHLVAFARRLVISLEAQSLKRFPAEDEESSIAVAACWAPLLDLGRHQMSDCVVFVPRLGVSIEARMLEDFAEGEASRVAVVESWAPPLQAGHGH